ncbi:MAG: oxidoreductase, partial [Pseudomonadota bacterium]
NGNVAIDVLRLLAKSPVEFDGSDIEPEFVDDGVETIHIVGRSPLEKAKFDAVMIKELGGLESANAMIADGDSLVPDSDDQKVSALRTLFGTHKDGAKKTVIFHSGWTVTAFGGDNGKVMSVSLENHKEERRVIDCDSVVSAIGFEDAGTLVENKTLPVPDENGALGGGLFAAGWFKRGPKGTIPENRTDSQSVANSIVAYLDGVSIWQKPGRMALMPSIQDKATTYEHWLAIDERERASAPPGRVRSKIRNRRDMFAIIKEQRVTG